MTSPTSPTAVDILVCGGGPSGLAAAVCLGTTGANVLCIDPVPPVTVEGDDGADLRTTAILQPGRALLDEAGIWSRLAPHAMPLQVMQIMDATVSPPVQRAFDASDLGPDLPFGWNLPNWLLRREMMARIDEMPNVTFRTGVGFRALLSRTAEARVTLTDGSQVTAALVVAADGRTSPVRQACGINVRTYRYGQKALAFSVTHAVPHNNISTEVHRAGGPFTLVPLPDLNGKPRSAVVWMTDGAEAQRLAALPEEDFNAEATARCDALLGPLHLAGRRSVWPIVAQLAERFDGPRVALMAEAAHVVPPIGAQGLNMSLNDLRALMEMVVGAEDPGAPEGLRRYSRARKPDVQARVLGIDLLNRTSQAGKPLAQALRRTGISALYGLKPARLAAMRLGLGARG